LQASFLFAGTSACILKRSGLVPTALVFSFGVGNVFWSILVAWVHGWMKMDGSTIAGPHDGQDGLEAQSLFAGTSACILKRSGLVPTALVFSFAVRNVFDTDGHHCHLQAVLHKTTWRQTFGTGVLRDQLQSLSPFSHASI
jgi:hypothetical protein